MRLVTFLDNSARPHIGALAKDSRIADLNAAHAQYQREFASRAEADSVLAADMRAYKIPVPKYTIFTVSSVE